MGLVEKFGFYLTILIMVLLLHLIFFSRNGFQDYQSLKQKEMDIVRVIESVHKDNRRIENQIRGLKTDGEYIRHLARHEHGMAAPDELIFRQKKIQ